VALQSCTRLGPYEILAPIGAGGMGEVYRAKDTRLGREVAVKILPAEFAADPERLRRFEHEARAAAALNHPNILVLHDLGTHDGAPYIVTELLEGESLRQRLRGGPLPPAKAVDFGIQIAQGLAVAHERGIIHRDLKPENLFVTKDGRVKILDFGLARLLRPMGSEDVALSEVPTTDQPTREGMVLGTLGYMSPEQVRGQTCDHRADLFAFGCVLHEMLSGKRTFAKSSAADTLAAILKEDPPPLPPTSPIAMDRIVRHCLEKRPDDRFSSAHDLALALQSVSLTGEAGSAPAVTASVPPPPAPVAEPAPGGWLRRHWPKLLAGVAAVALIALAVGWAVWFRQGKSTPKGAALNPKRVAVRALENQTGERSLDSLGRMASDSLSQGLSKIPGIETAPSSPDAGRVVSGTYYLQGQTLRFQVKVSDAATGQIIYAPQPFTGSRDEPQKVIDALCQHVMGAIAWLADGGNPLQTTPPTYEAYQEYVVGRQFSGSDLAQAVRHQERAAEIDPDFAFAEIQMVMDYGNYGECEKVSAVVDHLNEHRERLTPFEQDMLDGYGACLTGQNSVALARFQHAAKLNPKDEASRYQVGFAAVFLNMPRLVLETLPDPLLVFKTQQSRSGLAPYSFTVIADACHLLGDYQRELEVADKGIPLFPDVLEVRFGKVRACAGLGRAEEVVRTVDETVGASFVDGTPDDVMLIASLELRAHGNREAALKMASQSVEWLRARPASEQSAARYRPALARALYAAERWDEARELFQELARDTPLAGTPIIDRATPVAAPHVPECRRIGNAIEYLGTLGALAARRNDRKEALRISSELARIDYKYVMGRHSYSRARIAAQLGEKGQAVDLLRQAASEGYSWNFPIIIQVPTLAFHASMDLEPLHGYAPFEELLKPKG
jgi:serine/threonine protein kinase/tetratricopeptide (TPR) repeat protein